MGRFALGTLIVLVALTFGVLVRASRLRAAAYLATPRLAPHNLTAVPGAYGLLTDICSASSGENGRAMSLTVLNIPPTSSQASESRGGATAGALRDNA